MSPVYLGLLGTSWVLCQFVSLLAKEKLKHRTIKAYLSAVRFLQIKEGTGDPFQGKSTPARVRAEGYLLSGVGLRTEARGEKDF